MIVGAGSEAERPLRKALRQDGGGSGEGQPLDALKVELTRFPEAWEVGNGKKKGAKIGPKDFAWS